MRVLDELEWDIIHIIYDCLSNPTKPELIDDFIECVEFDANLHQKMFEVPLASKHLLTMATKFRLASQEIEDELAKNILDSKSRAEVERLQQLIDNHAIIVTDLSYSLMTETLIAEGIDVGNICLYHLDSWHFTYSSLKKTQRESVGVEKQNVPMTSRERVIH